MRVVIAGSRGLVGSALHRAFSSTGYDVVELHRGIVDLRDFGESLKFFSEVRPNIVIDAAAHVGGIGANSAFPVNFINDNLRLQLNLMEASHQVGVEKFVFLGSSCIYPKNCKQPIKEKYLMTGLLESTNSAYAVAKIAGIEMVNSYRKQYGLPWISVMPTNLYGPGDNFDKENSHVMPALIRRYVEAEIANSNSVTNWGTGRPLRDLLHVDDFASAVLHILNKYNGDGPINIGSGQEISIRKLAELIARTSGYRGRTVWDSSKPDGTPRKILDTSLISNLNWSPEIPLDQGVKSTVDWYRSAIVRNSVRQ